MKDDLGMIFQKALATAKTKEAYETKILEAEQAVHDITSKTEELKGLVHRHKHNRIDRRLPIGLAVLAGGIILTLTIISSIVNNDMNTEDIIALSIFTAPAYIAAGLLLGFFFRSLGKHKKLTVKYEAELAEHEAKSPVLLPRLQAELESVKAEAKEFWAREKQNLAMFPPKHRNSDSIAVIAETAKLFNFDNLENALAIGEIRLTNLELSRSIDELREEIDGINKSIDRISKAAEENKKSNHSFIGSVILLAALDSIFD